MNFYDEAIEAKHKLQTDLVYRRRELKDLARSEIVQRVMTGHVVAETLYDYDINALEDADPYFWDNRIAQMVLASGQQLPETVTFDAAWLKGKAGYWWFGRSSPLIGYSHDNERKYVSALLWKLNPNGSLHVQTFSCDGVIQHSLGALSWDEGESLAEALRRADEVKDELPKTPDVVVRKIAIELAKDSRKLSHELTDLTQKCIDKHGEVLSIRKEASERGVDLEGNLTPKQESNINGFDIDKLTRDLTSNAAREVEEEARVEQFEGEQQHRLTEWFAASKNALVTFACGSLWMKQKIVAVAQAPLARAAQRRLAKAGIEPKCLVVELRSKQYTRTTPEDEKSHVDWAWRWAVRGHWRDQPTKDGIKLIWIHPFIKGPDDKPLKPNVARIFAVTR